MLGRLLHTVLTMMEISFEENLVKISSWSIWSSQEMNHPPTTARFHAPTKGVGLRIDLFRLGFWVLLIDEFKTSTSCPDCFNTRTNTLWEL